MPLQKVRESALCRVGLPHPSICRAERQQDLHIIRRCVAGECQCRYCAFEFLGLEQRQSNLLIDIRQSGMLPLGERELTGRYLVLAVRNGLEAKLVMTDCRGQRALAQNYCRNKYDQPHLEFRTDHSDYRFYAPPGENICAVAP